MAMIVKGWEPLPATGRLSLIRGPWFPLPPLSGMDDSFDLTRFVDTQRSVFDQALKELTAGRKRSHWMWFMFPQIAGLGFSAMAQRYAIRSLGEAQGYLRHPLLGPRLQVCTAAVNQVTGRSAHDIFGAPDDAKFHSSMTLFTRADAEVPDFRIALAHYFDGKEDPHTLAKLGLS